MAEAVTTSAAASIATRRIILDATRCWRSARDSRRPVQPALYKALAVHRCAALTPVLDSLLMLYESCIGRRLRAGSSGQMEMSGDEHDLLDLLAAEDGEPILPETGLSAALRVALRSARIMLRLALDPGERAPALRGLAPA